MPGALTLDEWLAREKATHPDRTETWFAERVPCSQGTVNKLRSGTTEASALLALAIEDATRGQVRAESLPMGDQSQKDLRRLRRRLALARRYGR